MGGPLLTVPESRPSFDEYHAMVAPFVELVPGLNGGAQMRELSLV